MGLGDVAGAADDGRDVGAGVEQPGLGAEGDLGVVVAPGQGLDEGHHVLVGVYLESRYVVEALDVDAGLGADGVHLRLQGLGRVIADFTFQGFGVVEA